MAQVESRFNSVEEIPEMGSYTNDRPAILFLCLGNICRSPLAEGAAPVGAALNDAILIRRYSRLVQNG